MICIKHWKNFIETNINNIKYKMQKISFRKNLIEINLQFFIVVISKNICKNLIFLQTLLKLRPIIRRFIKRSFLYV